MALESLEADPELSILLSLQALRTVYTREAQDALHRALPASRVRMALSGHTNGARSVEFSPDGKTIATTSSAGEVTIWETSSGQELFNLPGSIARYSPDGAHLASGSQDGTLTLWDFATRGRLRTMSGDNQRVFDVCFSPDGELLVSTRVGGVFEVWDTETGRKVFSSPAMFSGYDVLQNVTFSPDSRLLISTNIYGPDRIDMQVWGVDQDWILLNQSPGYREIEFSPDGRWLVAPGGELGTDILLWDLTILARANLAPLDLSATEPIVVPAKEDTTILDFAFSPDGSLLATGYQDGSADIWRVSPNGLNLLMTLSGHTKEVTEVAFSPDGARLATASDDGNARIWDITPEGAAEWFGLSAHDSDIYYFELTADGKYLATAGYEGAAKVWDLASRKLLVTITEHGGPLVSASISSDGSLLATGGYDNIAKIWKLQLSPGKPTYELQHTLSGHTAGPPIVDKGDGIIAIFSPDGTKLATGGEDGMAKVWDVSTGRELLSLQAHPDRLGVHFLAFSPDGRLLATGSASASDDRNALVKIWDAESGEEISTLSEAGQTGGMSALAFSPDGERLATGSDLGSLKIRDVKTGEVLKDLLSRSLLITSVGLSPDGKFLVSSQGDGTAKVWDASSGQILQVYTKPGKPGSFFNAAFTPDGKKVVASGSRNIYGYIFDTEELISLADSRLTRWFTLDECRRYLHLAECPPR
jgi:WD40 repeat protein